MKKIFTFLTILVSSFFFCSSVNADTLTFTLNETSYNSSFVSSTDFDRVLQDSIDTLQGRLNAFVITVNPTNSKYWVYYLADYTSTSTTYNPSSSRIELTFNVAFYDLYSYQFGSWSHTGTYNRNYMNVYLDYSGSSLSYQFAYFYYNGTSNGVLNTTSDTFVINTTFNTFTISPNGYFPSLYDIYNSPPTPTDDYPILTSFYNLVITKLAFITEYIYSSYVLLSIFAILILYFVILLFRRLR